MTRWTRLTQVLLSPALLLVERGALWPLYAVAVCFGISNGGQTMSMEMMRGLTMDHDEQRTGLRREGLLLSVNAIGLTMPLTVHIFLD